MDAYLTFLWLSWDTPCGACFLNGGQPRGTFGVRASGSHQSQYSLRSLYGPLQMHLSANTTIGSSGIAEPPPPSRLPSGFPAVRHLSVARESASSLSMNLRHAAALALVHLYAAARRGHKDDCGGGVVQRTGRREHFACSRRPSRLVASGL